MRLPIPPRVRWLLRILLVWVVAIFLRLAWLQVLHHDDLLRAAQQQQQKMVEIPAVRGAILDRGGQPLAKTLPAESICVNPLKIPDLGLAADLLSQVLKIDRDRLFERLHAASARSSGFLWVKRKLSAQEAARLRSMKWDWVEFRSEMRRFYPHGQLASHVVGSTGIRDDGAEGGNGGLELAFEEELAGRPGLQRVFTDVKQNPYDSVLARKPERARR
jgi:cell division protein FtsI/penicillin-binding protein 2